jgi:hypothetical protein
MFSNEPPDIGDRVEIEWTHLRRLRPRDRLS